LNGRATQARDKAVSVIGNLVHDSVPISNDEVRHIRVVWELGTERQRGQAALERGADR